jgi:hypothetical protein
MPNLISRPRNSHKNRRQQQRWDACDRIAKPLRESHGAVSGTRAKHRLAGNGTTFDGAVDRRLGRVTAMVVYAAALLYAVGPCRRRAEVELFRRRTIPVQPKGVRKTHPCRYE